MDFLNAANPIAAYPLVFFRYKAYRWIYFVALKFLTSQPTKK